MTAAAAPASQREFISEALEYLHTPFSTIERCTDLFGYVPIASTTIASPVRLIAAQVQFVIGIIGVFAATILRSREGMNSSIEILLHSGANFIRSTVELIPFINMLTIAHDLTHKRFEYSSIRDSQ